MTMMSPKFTMSGLLVSLLATMLACTPETTDSGGGDSAEDTDSAADDSGSSDSGDTGDSGDSGGLRTCDDIEADFWAETEDIRACAVPDDCGQQLTGTSCGCTRDWVARWDADTTDFYALMAEGNAASCDVGGESTCDCPEVAGYDCVDNVCEWAYVDDQLAYPACNADEGYAYDVDSVELVGDEILVGVGYGGGCASHWFSTCWPDASFMESNPVQADLELLHEGDGPDMCDAYFFETVTVDLIPLRTAYQDSYGETGTIVVNIAGEQVQYSF